MAKDFFGNLGQALSKTAKELSGRAEDVYETQRLKNKISAEERQIDKIMADLGKIVYQRYKEEVRVDDAQKALCEQIDQRIENLIFRQFPGQDKNPVTEEGADRDLFRVTSHDFFSLRNDALCIFV